jgi:hypothetical protein
MVLEASGGVVVVGGVAEEEEEEGEEMPGQTAPLNAPSLTFSPSIVRRPPSGASGGIRLGGVAFSALAM